MNRIRHCIFDFDGTLADTSEGIVACVRETLRRMDLPDQPAEQIRMTIGLPLYETIRLGGKVPEDRVNEGVDTYRSIFFEVASKYILLFPGVRDAVNALHAAGVSLSIATSRGRDSLDKILEEYGLKDLFSIKATSSGNWKPKPDPDMVLYILGELGADASETLVIGDTTYDLMMGAGAGCRTCGVSWGNHSRELLESVNPDYVIDDVKEMVDIVCG